MTDSRLGAKTAPFAIWKCRGFAKVPFSRARKQNSAAKYFIGIVIVVIVIVVIFIVVIVVIVIVVIVIVVIVIVVIVIVVIVIVGKR